MQGGRGLPSNLYPTVGNPVPSRGRSEVCTMEEEKYLPELMAEKDSLDPSFVHASRLLAEGRTCSPGGNRQLAPVTAAGFGERSWGGRPSPSRRLSPKVLDPELRTEQVLGRRMLPPSLPPQLNLGSPELRALWRWRRALLGSLMERSEELRGPRGYFHSAERREINFE